MRPQYFATLLIAVVTVTACADQSAVPTAVLPAAAASANSAGALVGFGFNGTASGFPTGEVTLTGGGSFSPATASNTVGADTRVHAGGGFSCNDPVNQGPLANCAAGEGVRWDTVQLLASTTFKCTAADVARPASTSDRTAVLLADFYRAGDANDESFTAQMIVSDTDLAGDIQGLQNIWIQGVGCGTAIVNFSK